MAKIVQWDRDLFVFLNNLGNVSFDPFWILVSSKLIWIPLYLLFLFLLYRNFKIKTLIFMLIFIALGITLSDQLAGIFKNGILRLRPCHDPDLQNKIRIVQCGGLYGFYSSHASNAFFIANYMTMMLWKKYGKFTLFLFIWAATVAFSRIYLGVHFPLDIAMGAAVGFLLGGFFATLTRNVIKKQTTII